MCRVRLFVLHFWDAAEEVFHTTFEVEVLLDVVLAVFADVGAVACFAFGEFKDAGAAWAYIIIDIVASAEAAIYIQ